MSPETLMVLFRERSWSCLEENSFPKAGADVTLLVENLIFDSPLPDALPVFKARHATFICCFVRVRQLSYWALLAQCEMSRRKFRRWMFLGDVGFWVSFSTQEAKFHWNPRFLGPAAANDRILITLSSQYSMPWQQGLDPEPSDCNWIELQEESRESRVHWHSVIS